MNCLALVYTDHILEQDILVPYLEEDRPTAEADARHFLFEGIPQIQLIRIKGDSEWVLKTWNRSFPQKTSASPTSGRRPEQGGGPV